VEKRTYTFNHSVDISLETACTQYLQDIGTTKEAIKIVSEKFKTERKWLSKENLDHQKKRFLKGQKNKADFKYLLKLQKDIENIKEVLQEA
jgi:hypothetical protein